MSLDNKLLKQTSILTVFGSSESRFLLTICNQQSYIVVHAELQTSGTFVSNGWKIGNRLIVNLQAMKLFIVTSATKSWCLVQDIVSCNTAIDSALVAEYIGVFEYEICYC